MHHREESSHCVIDLLISWLGSMVPWTSFGYSLSSHSSTPKLPLSLPHGYVFPSSAFMAFIAVSIINIVLVVALGWYVLGCAADNCFTVFLPLFASAAPLGNWALYRVGLNVLSYVGGIRWVSTTFPNNSSLLH